MYKMMLNSTFKIFSANTSEKLLIIILLLICMIFRLIMLKHTYGINNDGVIYIYVAQKFWEGNLEGISSCVGSILGIIYALTIAFFYSFLRNWELSGNMTSIVYSSLAVIPLFKILHHIILSRYYAFILALIALNLPYIIKQSVDVIRDTAYWFFLLLGIYFFLNWLGTSAKSLKYSRFYLLVSIFSFLLAGINRVEGFFVGFISFVFFLYKRGVFVEKSRYFFIGILTFCLGIILIFIFCPAIYDYIFHKSNFNIYHSNYKYYYNDLTKLYSHTHNFFWVYFRFLLPYIPTFITLLLIIKVYNLMFPFLIYGIFTYYKEPYRSLFAKYVTSVFWSYFLLLILWSYSYAYLSKRYFVPLILIGLPLVGLGIKNFVQKQNFHHGRLLITYSIVGILIISPLFTIFSPRREDELIYKKAASIINKIEDEHKNPITIAGNNRKISFYANLERKPAQCVLRMISPQGFFDKCNADYLVLSKEEQNIYQDTLVSSSKIIEIAEINGWKIFKCKK